MKRLGPELAGLIRGLGLEDEVRLQSVRDRWSELVGAQLSEHLDPGFLSGPTLHVSASSAAWLEQAGFYRDEMLKRLRPLGITALKFKPGPLGKAKYKHLRAGKIKMAPPLLTADEMKQVDIALHPVKDEEFRELCRRVMTRAIVRERRALKNKN